MTSKVRYAVVGAGTITQQCFLPAIVASDNSMLTAIFTGNAESTWMLAQKCGCDCVLSYDAYDDALSKDLFDAIYIAVPNQLHAAYAIPALNSGKDVMVEKPISTTIADAKAMIAAAEAKGRRLMMSYRMHTDPVTHSVIERIRDGGIGDVRFFTSFFSFQVDAGNHRLSADSWAGPLQDIGIYCVNLAREVFNAEPVECFATTTHLPGDERFAEIEDSASVTLTFPGMCSAQFVVSFGAAAVDEYLVVGTEGRIRVTGGLRMDTRTDIDVSGREAHIYSHEPREQFVPLVASFSDSILSGAPVRPDGVEGLRDLEILHALETSMKRKMTVRIQRDQ